MLLFCHAIASTWIRNLKSLTKGGVSERAGGGGGETISTASALVRDEFFKATSPSGGHRNKISGQFWVMIM